MRYAVCQRETLVRLGRHLGYGVFDDVHGRIFLCYVTATLQINLENKFVGELCCIFGFLLSFQSIPRHVKVLIDAMGDDSRYHSYFWQLHCIVVLQIKISNVRTRRQTFFQDSAAFSLRQKT